MTVHIQPVHAGIYGQWIDSWRPRPNSKEIALIVEDDLTLSPWFYLWLKAAYARYHRDPNVMGFSLRGNSIVSGSNTGNWLQLSANHTAFMYKLMGTHGFAPLPGFWRKFQDWYHVNIKNSSFHPYVPDIVLTTWYKQFEEKGTEDSMWEMWVTHFGWINQKFTVYPSLGGFNQGRGELIVHRAEKGLHSSGERFSDRYINLLLQKWHPSFGRMPDDIIKYDWNGDIIMKY